MKTAPGYGIIPRGNKPILSYQQLFVTLYLMKDAAILIYH